MKKIFYLIKNGKTLLLLRKWEKRRDGYSRLMVANACDDLGLSHNRIKYKLDYCTARRDYYLNKINEDEFKEIVLNIKNETITEKKI
jgi:hypothetical protein